MVGYDYFQKLIPIGGCGCVVLLLFRFSRWNPMLLQDCQSNLCENVMQQTVYLVNVYSARIS